jgi:hypothetical protein
MPGRRFVSPIEFARQSDLPQWLLRRAIRAGVIPETAVLRCGSFLRIDLACTEEVIAAIKAWAAKERPRARAGRMSDREARIRRIVEGGK